MRTRPDALKTISLPSGAVVVDSHGYLTDPDQWTTDFAEYVARQENITLTPSHYEVVEFMRKSLRNHGVIPDARFVFKFLGKPENLTKSDAKNVLFALFPYGYVKQACKIAGMKQPRAWSTG